MSFWALTTDMTSYIVDSDALQEDEELIEAVNELVGSVSESVKAEIESEVSEFVAFCKHLLERFFPVILEYQQEPARIQQDLENAVIFLCLLAVAVWILAPSKRAGTSRRKPLLHDDNGLGKSNSGWFVVKDSNRHRHRRSYSFLGSRHSEDDSESERLLSSNCCYTDDETDEERFEKMWSISIVNSGYSKLVLPPSCRLVGKGVGEKQLHPPHKEKEKQKQLTPKTSNAAQSTEATTHHKSDNEDNRDDDNDTNKSSTVVSSSSGGGGDDDNPAARLQNYLRQLWFFIRSLISYDYTTAGKTLITWLQGIQRIQHYRRHAATHQTTNINSDANTTAIDNETTSTVDGSVEESSSPSKKLMPVADDDEKKQDEFIVEFKSAMRIVPNDIKFLTDDHSSIRSDAQNTATAAAPSNTPTRTTSTGAAGNSGTTPLPDLRDETTLRSTLNNRGELRSLELPWIKAKSLVKNGRQQMDGSVNFDHPTEATLIGEASTSSSLEKLHSNRWHPPAQVALPRQRPLMRQQQHSKSSESASLLMYEDDQKSENGSKTNERDQAKDPLSTTAEHHVPVILSSGKNPNERLLPAEISNRHFFDAATSRDSLNKMSVEVSVPDKNGYIIGDEFLPDSTRFTPLLVFVNSRSGPQQGHLLITQLRRLLNPIQVWDLANGGPRPVLESFLVLSRLRILVCGGDGTVSWIINILEEMKVSRRKWPPIAILPLGTGNDLARIHGWGGGYNNESLITILEQISESYSSLLDRWEVTINDKKSKKKEVKGFFNYLGVGADAQAALQVHYLRESRPEWFFSRMVNKAMYGIFGAEDIIKATTVHVRKDIKLIADGVEVPLPPDSQGIILLNIDAYAGGVPLWSHGVKMNVPAVVPQGPRRTRSMTEFDHMNLRGRLESIERVDSVDDVHNLMSTEERFAHVTACDMPSSCQDGYLDVVSIRGAFHLGQIKVGLSNAQRLCQCREATVVIKSKVAVQVDGEPWRQRSCTLTIKRKKDPAVMLHRSADDGGVETEMSKLLDWAEARNMIDSQVHAILMKEFSRRIESKTRQRRVRAQDNIMSTLKKAISSGAMVNLSGSHHNSWQAGGGIAF